MYKAEKVVGAIIGLLGLRPMLDVNLFKGLAAIGSLPA